jgi:hypothetical protein
MDFTIYTTDAAGRIIARQDLSSANRDQAIAMAHVMKAPPGGKLEIWELATLLETVEPASATA